MGAPDPEVRAALCINSPKHTRKPPNTKTQWAPPPSRTAFRGSARSLTPRSRPTRARPRRGRRTTCRTTGRASGAAAGSPRPCRGAAAACRRLSRYASALYAHEAPPIHDPDPHHHKTTHKTTQNRTWPPPSSRPSPPSSPPPPPRPPAPATATWPAAGGWERGAIPAPVEVGVGVTLARGRVGCRGWGTPRFRTRGGGGRRACWRRRGR